MLVLVFVFLLLPPVAGVVIGFEWMRKMMIMKSLQH